MEKFLRDTCAAILLDADGTFYDGFETRTVDADRILISKRRHFHDGQGLSFMRAIGLRILFVSGEGELLASHVRKFNELPSVKDGQWSEIEFCERVSGQSKIDAVERWLTKHGLQWSQCLYMGDDVNDLAAMRKVKEASGMVIAPANATRSVLAIADHVTKRVGGAGAIREVAEMIIDARGVDEVTFPSS